MLSGLAKRFPPKLCTGELDRVRYREGFTEIVHRLPGRCLDGDSVRENSNSN